MVVHEAGYGGIKYPKKTITRHAAENRVKETKAERKLFFFLIKHRGGALRGRFRRQHIVGGRWIVDFYFPEVRLAIEVDGGYHRDPRQERKDRLKDATLAEHYITLVRLRNGEVFGDQDALVRRLRQAWIVAKHSLMRLGK
jgi:very-short-patch-repair endonuclease